jgi:hypothetical protein
MVLTSMGFVEKWMAAPQVIPPHLQINEFQRSMSRSYDPPRRNILTRCWRQLCNFLQTTSLLSPHPQPRQRDPRLSNPRHLDLLHKVPESGAKLQKHLSRARQDGWRPCLQLLAAQSKRRHLVAVASRPRFGCDSQARTPQLVWTSWRETQLGRNQLERHSWTGASYSPETSVMWCCRARTTKQVSHLTKRTPQIPQQTASTARLTPSQKFPNAYSPSCLSLHLVI